MLTRPSLSDDILRQVLARHFAIAMGAAIFVPSGDANSAVFRISSERGRYVLKLRSGNFDASALAVAAFLHSSGIAPVMAPLESISNQLSIAAHGFDWILYPHFEGSSGFEAPLTRAHWAALGDAMRKVHDTALPSDLAQRLPRESYSDRFRAIVRILDEEVSGRHFDDVPAAKLAEFSMRYRTEIRSIVDRAESLAQTLQNRTSRFVLCHTDLHAGNVLVGPDISLAIIDWDNPLLAPRERDLMFIGAGVGGIWIESREAEWFYEGYGSIEVDAAAIAYYRCERVVIDFADYGEYILHGNGTAEDRTESVRRFVSAFAPNNPVDMAMRTKL